MASGAHRSITHRSRDPVYQFRLANNPANNPADECQEPHWHAWGRVFSLAEQGGLSDPDPPTCGFGKYTDLKPTSVFIPADDWAAFKKNHPPG